MKSINKEHQYKQSSRFDFLLLCACYINDYKLVSFCIVHMRVDVISIRNPGTLRHDELTFLYQDSYQQTPQVDQPSTTYENEASDAQEFVHEYVVRRKQIQQNLLLSQN